MLPKYAENFERLSVEQAGLLATAIHKRHGETVVIERCDGLGVFEACDRASLDQADVVMSLARDGSVLAVQTLEVVLGTPVERFGLGQTAIDPITNRMRGEERPKSTLTRSDPRVVKSVKPNPKKPGSAAHGRYELWRVGATITEMLREGLTMADVKWDTDRGFVELGE